MKNAFKSIKRMRFMAFLIVIQLSVGLTMLNSTSTIVESTIKKVDGFSNLLNFEKTLLFRGIKNNKTDEIEPIYKMEQNLKSFGEMYHKLDELKEKNIIARNTIYFSIPGTAINLLKDNIPEKYKKLTQQQLSDYTSTILVNKDLIENYDLEIYEGRGFTAADFDLDYKKDYIPIVIGKSYMKSVKIGDKFETIATTGRYKYTPIEEVDSKKIEEYENSYTGIDIYKKVIDGKEFICETERETVKFEVIGFYGASIPSINSKLTLMQSLVYSDALTIMPIIKNCAYLNEKVAIGDFGVFVEYKNEGQVSYVEEQLKPILNEGDLKLSKIDIKDNYVSMKASLVKDVINSFALGAVLTILSVIGITSVLLGELNERRKEFGIRIACGANLKTLSKELMMEILIMVSGSAILSLLSLWIKQVFSNSESYMSIGTILLNLAIVLVLTLVIGIVPIVKLRKLNIIDLVKGE